MAKRLDLVGRVFGRLTVIEYSHSQNDRLWRCLCDCGNETIVRTNHLRLGRIKSCGCLRKDTLSETKTIHGKRHSREYNAWCAMVQRCKNPKNKRYKHYGGRGIEVCDKWKTFAGFYEDMGERPPAHSLDRINNDGGYCKDNCRWATNEEQANNRQSSRYVDVAGVVKTIAQWAKHTNINQQLIRKRLLRGWSPEKAIFAEASPLVTQSAN